MIADFKLNTQLAQDSIELMDLPLCKLLLVNDANFLWFILVPRVADIEEIFQLEWQAQQQLLNEPKPIWVQSCIMFHSVLIGLK